MRSGISGFGEEVCDDSVSGEQDVVILCEEKRDTGKCVVAGSWDRGSSESCRSQGCSEG